ncbi:hypothetical protein AKJ09_08830 [Labilithrix luteola]|uniref:LTD domain-containing protein n=1 Tax=Labilithrix luteola TaxID=1391654 RepID=A0A0K1Q906_9BACT|nr:lamin tail domain-containing protein [Labilithrix luteola]AKV02167.1 hypothetical protein AKJ09_08830 [Labilithrix luteola]
MAIGLLGVVSLFACAASETTGKKHKATPVDPGDDFFNDDAPSQEQPLSPSEAPDGGAVFGASSRPSTRDSGTDAAPVVDAGPQPKVYCEGNLVAGHLAVTELLIASRAGSNDDGEWVEITNTRSCWLKIKGITVESPRGAAFNTATVTDDLEIGPEGSFIVADSLDPAKNHRLPGVVVSWNATDVLKNDGDTVTVKLGDTVIDSITYPAFSNLQPGRTLAFPDDCTWGVRSDWQRWSLSFDNWSTGMVGTPNATNDDVACY